MVNRTVRSTLCATLLSVVAVCPGLAQSVVTDVEVKAVLAYKISRFVHWPESAFPHSTSPFVFCVLGNDSFEAALDFLDNASVGGRAIVLTHLEDSAEYDTCHAIFTDVRGRTLRSILSQLRDEPILTFGDTAEFAENGGAVGLITERDKVRFVINPTVTRRAGLQVSAQLLQLATIVESKDGNPE